MATFHVLNHVRQRVVELKNGITGFFKSGKLDGVQMDQLCFLSWEGRFQAAPLSLDNATAVQ